MQKILMVAVLLFCFSGCVQFPENNQSFSTATIKIDSPTQPYDGAIKPIIRIRSYEIISKDRTRYGEGTGFFIEHNKKTYLVTAYHVLENTVALEFYTIDRKPILIKFDRPYFIPHLDAVVILIDHMSVKTTPYKLGTYKQGSNVSALGFPDGGKIAERKGMNYRSFVETTANVDVGMSGGPILDSNGNVIGIISAKIGHTVEDPNETKFLNENEVRGLFSRLDDVFYRIDSLKHK